MRREIFDHTGRVIPEVRGDFIYFIQEKSTSRIKIGKTSNIRQRFKTLMSFSALPELSIKLLINDKGNMEPFFHKKFSEFRIHGEWFSPSEELLTYIKIKQPQCKYRQMLKVCI